MKKIIVLGATGMLGSQVYNVLKNSKKYQVFFTTRQQINQKEAIFFDAANYEYSFSDFNSANYIINCIGVTKPFIDKSYVDSLLVNSIFPHKVAEYCNLNNIKLIHITTDCVFSGSKGKYTENSLHDCTDFYGKSKSLGESLNCMNVRTSIIGLEQTNFVHLLSWAISQKGKTINGFTNHLWNGVTTKNLSSILERIIDENFYDKKTFHIHSPNDINKYELLKLINNKFSLNLTINETRATETVDRTLRSNFELTSNFSKRSIEDQISDI